MAKHLLSAVEVKAAKGAHEGGKKYHADGGGLFLQVSGTGSKSWVFRRRDPATGKTPEVGMGSYPDISLAAARDLAGEMVKLTSAGVPAKLARDKLREQDAAEVHEEVGLPAPDVWTFSKAAKAYIDAKIEPESRSPKHVAQWRSSLETYAYPFVGDMDVADIDVPHVMEVLSPIWKTKSETASRVRLRMEHVLNWAAVQGARDRFNPAQWRGVLSHLLPAKEKIAPVQHFRAMPYSEVPGFLTQLRKKGGMGARALEFAIVCAARSGEVRAAVWSEIDLDKKLWTIPAGKMKANRKHIVPLSTAAVKLLKALPESDSELVFPAPRGGELSDMTLNKICRDMKVDAVPHGFRSSFKDWAREQTSYPDELSELALAHVNSDATRAAYARSDLLEQRRGLMKDWAKYLGWH